MSRRRPVPTPAHAPTTSAPPATALPTGFAPLAVAPDTIKLARRGRKRRWLYAAAFSGALASSPMVSTHGPGTPSSSSAGVSDTSTGHAAIGEVWTPPTTVLSTAFVEQADDAPRVAEPQTEHTEQIALADGVPLTLPSPETALVGFHESSSVAAVPMQPNTVLHDDHTWKPVVHADHAHTREADAPVVVLPPRDRPAGPTTALDIAIPHGEDVIAPISGTVVGVGQYVLYGEHTDTRIDIIPEGRPDLRVALIHIEDVAVSVGDHVTAGVTRLAGSAKAFPFSSQIDRFTEALEGTAMPHVHIEAKRVG